jgi:hypothetical protein
MLLGEINATKYALTSIATPLPLPLPSSLQYEPRPHDDHIYILVYVDMLHECQVVFHED